MNSRNSTIKAATAAAIKRVEDQLVAEIAACENDIRGGVEDLARLREALLSLRKQSKGTPHSKQTMKIIGGSTTSGRMAFVARPVRERPGSTASIIRSFLRRELRKAGHPLTRSEAAKRLEQVGVEINAKDPIKRIAKVLWSSPEFVNVGDGYWFSGEPIPDPTELEVESAGRSRANPASSGPAQKELSHEPAKESNDD